MKIFGFEFLSKIEIGEPDDAGKVYLIRWKLVSFGWFGIYLHKFLRSDYDRALHDHPWGFLSLILSGGYFEEHDQTEGQKKNTVWHRPGTILWRPPKWRHRVILSEGEVAWTLVAVGPRVRKWGFWLDSGWCWWRQHNPKSNICEDHVVSNFGSD